MKYKDFEKFIFSLKEPLFKPFSENIAKITVDCYCHLKDSGMTNEECILSTISEAASIAFRESIIQSLYIAFHIEPDKPLSRDELKSLLKVIRSDEGDQ